MSTDWFKKLFLQEAKRVIQSQSNCDCVGGTDITDLERIVDEYLTENPPSYGVDASEVEQIVKDYLATEDLTSLKIDERTLSFTNGVLSVNTTEQVEQDNTLPITSAAVYTVVGNIEILLGTI